MMHFMPWYETPAVRGRWGKHWTGPKNHHDPAQHGKDNLPDIWSHYHPLIGPYDSTDPAVLECQLLQMKLAGVDGVIVDWYGIGKAADYPSNHQASLALFGATARHGLSFAACFEDRSIGYMIKTGALEENATPAHLAETMAWMQDNWFSKPHYQHHLGRPLLLNFGPISVRNPAHWNAAFENLPKRPAFFTLQHLRKHAGTDAAFAWVHRDAWENPSGPKQTTERLQAIYENMSPDPAKLIPSALPGFDDVYEKSFPDLPHRNGDTLRESLDVAMNGPWPIIQLVTWNDYGEGTIIEPTHEFGYQFLEIIQQFRKKELGESFTATPADLRLPARLLALRKDGKPDTQKLNQISKLLGASKCQPARQLLDAR